MRDALTDHEAIRQIVYRYARGLDRLDRTLLRACYHDDAIDSRPPLFDGHVEAFLDWVLPVLSALDSSIHLIGNRSEEHTSELQSLMRISYSVFCWKKKKQTNNT